MLTIEKVQLRESISPSTESFRVGSRSFGLDLIRALAVCLVLVAHFAKALEFLGFWGVELFFALSGYLIGQIIWRSYSSSSEWSFSKIKNFWFRRWWRTLPNYYLFLIISIGFHFFTNGLPSAKTFSTFLWFGQNLTSRNGGFYGVSWSLCIEEWLYLTFPVILYLFSKMKLGVKTTFVGTIVSFFIGSVIIRQILDTAGQGQFLRTITLARLDSIAYGIGVAYLTSISEWSKARKQLSFCLGVLSILSSLYVATFAGDFLSELRQSKALLVIVPMGSALILLLCALLKPFRGSLNFLSSIVEKLSLWTYSIYLSHIPILFTCYYLLDGIRSSNVGNLISKFVGLIVTLAISGIIYRYFELPLTMKRPKEA
ncbi:acyltransferase family protein [Arcticibacter sp. MXS-1]|uniref:acyltransferase family protein n=1 Tax=Arcticibacter sp. MXS-1 TaxID=3341726 RepID=UPI0035A83F36